jgi:hypothetical protein
MAIFDLLVHAMLMALLPFATILVLVVPTVALIVIVVWILALVKGFVFGNMQSFLVRLLLTGSNLLLAVFGTADVGIGCFIHSFVLGLGMLQDAMGWIAPTPLGLFWQANATGVVGILLSSVVGLVFCNFTRTLKAISQVFQALGNAADWQVGFRIQALVIALCIAQTEAGWIAQSPFERYLQANATGFVAILLSTFAGVAFDFCDGTLKTTSQVLQAIGNAEDWWIGFRIQALVVALCIAQAEAGWITQSPFELYLQANATGFIAILLSTIVGVVFSEGTVTRILKTTSQVLQTIGNSEDLVIGFRIQALVIVLYILQVVSGWIAQSPFEQYCQANATGLCSILLSSIAGLVFCEGTVTRILKTISQVAGLVSCEGTRILKTFSRGFQALGGAADWQVGFRIQALVIALCIAQTEAGMITPSPFERYLQANATGFVAILLSTFAGVAFDFCDGTLKTTSQVLQAIGNAEDWLIGFRIHALVIALCIAQTQAGCIAQSPFERYLQANATGFVAILLSSIFSLCVDTAVATLFCVSSNLAFALSDMLQRVSTTASTSILRPFCGLFSPSLMDAQGAAVCDYEPPHDIYCTSTTNLHDMVMRGSGYESGTDDSDSDYEYESEPDSDYESGHYESEDECNSFNNEKSSKEAWYLGEPHPARRCMEEVGTIENVSTDDLMPKADGCY